MNETGTPQLQKFAGSVGLLVDRSAVSEEVLATVFRLDNDKVATCAHSAFAYARNLEALKVVFPATGLERGVSRALFHPKFNQKSSTRLTRQTVTDAQPALALQKYNAVVLALTNLTVLSESQKTTIDKSLSLPMPVNHQGMNGNLEEIDLPLVIQTVTTARKEGTIVISDRRNRPLASLFCARGQVQYAKYKNLSNDLALFQIIEHQLLGHFTFQSASEPDWEGGEPIGRPVDMLLIEAHRRLDELAKLISSVGGRSAAQCHAVELPDFSILPAELRETAADLWQFLDGTVQCGQLWNLVNADDYLIFRCLNELSHTRQIEDVSHVSKYMHSGGQAKFSSELSQTPPPLGVQVPLSPMDKIGSLSIAYPSARPRLREGSLLGVLHAGDPWHLVHNVRLLPQTNGSPMFKDGSIIGMHCGALPVPPHSTESVQQMLWIECVLQCLSEGGEQALVRQLSATGSDNMQRLSGLPAVANAAGFSPTQSSRQHGCARPARLACPKCGSPIQGSTRVCKKCGTRPELDLTKPKSTRTETVLPTVVLAVGLVLFLTVAVVLFSTRLPAKPDFAASSSVLLPEQPWVELTINKFSPKKEGWVRMSEGTVLNKSDRIYIGMNFFEPCHFYLLSRSSTSNQAQLVYPASGNQDAQVDSGSKLAFPSDYEKKAADNKLELGGITFNGPAATEMLIAVACHDKLNLDSSSVINETFRSAVKLLERGDLTQGIEVDASTLSPSLVPKASSQSLVYIERLPLTHSN